ncbi:MAG: biopolymer transport protein ExbD [Mariniblastus sp.]|jgi:biopolymer transport protein ExbD
MKRSSPLVQRGSEIDMDSAMTPMIDVVFLLLVFFVWTASFQIVEHILPSEMSQLTGSDPINAAEPPPKDYKDIVVKIGWDGANPNWKINTESYASLAEVQRKLTTVAEIGTEAPVILHPTPIVPLGFVIEAYDAAKRSGFDKISFAVNPQRGR